MKYRENWPTKKLGEACERIKIEKAPVGAVPYIEIGDVDIDTKTINFKEKGSVKGSIFAPSGSVIISRVRPTRGAVALLDKKFVISSAFTVLKSKLILDTKFLFYYLAYNPKFFEYLGKRQKGSNYPSCREKDILDFEIPLPPIKIQKRIVARIEKVFEKIDKAKELRQKALEETEQILPSALKENFSRTEKKWGKKKLKEICVINPSKTELKNLPENSKVSFVPMSAVDDTNGLIVKQESKLLKEVKKGYTYFKEGDVLFAKITPCMENGKSAIAENLVNRIGFGSTEFHVLRSLKEVLPKWIHFYIRQPWFREEARRHFTGTAGQQRVPQEFLEKIEIPLPPLSEQKKIVAYLDNLRKKVEKLKQLQQSQSKELAELKQSILDKAFKGELVK